VETFSFQTIGVVRTPHTTRSLAPRQGRAAEGIHGTLELFPGRGFEDALSDLERWSYAWVLFVFHENLDLGWRPKVLPPRSDVKRGVFATRSPHRPNPIGLSVVRIDEVDGLTVHVSELDILDGTPLLDIKPYVAWADAIPAAGGGWLRDDPPDAPVKARPPDPRDPWEVSFCPDARAQLAFLEERGLDLEPRLRSVLRLGPQPHAYRRIRPESEGVFRLALGEWRARFRTDGRRIEVLALSTGYRPKELHVERADEIALDIHRMFLARWP
jgi:tRNA-Thr(GGU) m(6)t(6)A37 methyltransferase TsaA